MLLARSKNIAYRTINNKTYIVDTRNSYLHSLNEIGTEIWECLSKQIEFEELLNKLLLEYEIDEETLRGDLTEFVEELIKKNLVEII